jgi:hypothetical protein
MSSSKKYSNLYALSPKNSEGDDDVYNHFINTNNVQTATNSQNKYEKDRSKRHMEHYFDTNKFATETKPDLEDKIQPPPSKAQLEYWKAKKEEKKNKKKEWLMS